MSSRESRNSFQVYKRSPRLFVFSLIYPMYLLFPVIARLINPEWPDELIPSMWLMILWAVPVYIFVLIRNILSRIICLCWMFWFLVGSINIIASYLRYGIYYLINVQLSTFVYIVFTTVLFLSLLLVEIITERGHTSTTTKVIPRTAPQYDVPPFFAAFLFAFPLVWFASVYLSIGYIPLLSGVNIEYSMYESDFGPLYGFAAINVISMLLLFDKSQSASSQLTKYGYLASLALVGFISVMTGKRMMLMIFLLAALCYLLTLKRILILRWALLIKGVAIVAVSYIGIMVFRQGVNLDILQTTELQLSLIGVEYRDFVYAVDKFTSYDLYDYNWAASTLISGLNSRVLGLLGFNKQEILETALGYVAKPLFMGGDFGVRTGLVSELFLAYSYWGVLIIFSFGIVVGWFNRRIVQCASKSSLIFMSAIYGLLATAIVAQSIDIVGTLTVMFYTWVLYKGLQLFTAGLFSHPKPLARQAQR